MTTVKKQGATEETALTLYEKMHKVMSELSFISKDKRNDFHKYNYASEFAIKSAVHEQLVKHGLLFHISVLEYVRNGNIIDIKFTYSFTDTLTGTKIEGTFIGSGEDKGDKGTYKAITGAIKYILTSTFLIPTGDDPEEDKPALNGRVTPNTSAELTDEVKATIETFTNYDLLVQFAKSRKDINKLESFRKLVKAKMESLKKVEVAL